MKKALIAVLVIMTVFCTAAFAKSGLQNYSGLGVGFGFSHSTFTFKNPLGDVERVWKTNHLAVSITDFAFFDKSPVGVFLDGSLVINTNRSEIFVGHETSLTELPLGFSATIGSAFKFDVSKKVDLLLGVGFQIYSEVDKPETLGHSINMLLFGLGYDVEAAYSLGKGFSISLGVNGSLFFANRTRYVYPNHDPDDVSPDKYFEYRVIPKVMAYYVY